MSVVETKGCRACVRAVYIALTARPFGVYSDARPERRALEMFEIRKARWEDLPSILAIYNEAVLTSAATFDLEPQTLEQRSAWFAHYDDKHPVTVAEEDGQVIGYCSLSVFRPKPAYRNTVESSIYIDANCRGRGVGEALMRDMLARAERFGYHAVIAGITAGNKASIKLHERLGFQQAGYLKEVGFKFGMWHDICYYHLLLPRVSEAGPERE